MPSKWQTRLVIYAGLHHKEQVLLMANRLGISVNAVVGSLIHVWLKAQELATGTGLLENKTAAWLDFIVGVDGFAGAMAEVGWLVVAPGGLTVTKYDRHIAKTAVKKCDDVIRKRRKNGVGPLQTDLKPDTDRTHTGNETEKVANVTLAPIAPKPVPKKTTGKRPTKAEIGEAPPSPQFDAFWAAYPKWKRMGKFTCSWAWFHLGITDEMFGRVLASLEAWKKCEKWTKDGGRYVCDPLTWLNGRLWIDEVGGPDHQGGGRSVHTPGRVSAKPGKYASGGRRFVPSEGAESPPDANANGGQQTSLFTTDQEDS